MDKYIGKLLDARYEVLEVVGIGGMATIYKARCRVLNRFVAIKILKDEFARDAEFRQRFYMESQAVAKLSHPNIVAVYDVSHTEGLEYIVMELVEGVTLKDYMQNKSKLSWQETLYFTQQIARALSHAHSRGIIHQDIKPQNIMITNEGEAKVTDFGIASFAANQETRVVQEAIGSVHYISPEQAKGSTVDYRTDIYSLGVVMYEMLTGRLPFEGETALAIVMQHINAMPLKPSEVVVDVPAGMDEIVMHAMCPTVARRYASADELYTDLQALKANATAIFSYGMDAQRGDMPKLEETQSLPPFQEVRQSAAMHKAQQETVYAPRPETRAEGKKQKKAMSQTKVAVLAVVGFTAVLVIISLMLIFGGSATAKKIDTPVFVNQNINEIITFQADGSFVNNSQYKDFKFKLEPVLQEGKEDGLVFDQDPKSGSKMSADATVTLWYYKGSTAVEEYTLPSMKSQTKEWVTDAIERQNKQNRNVQIALEFQEETSDTIDKNLVIRTEPGEGAKMVDGDTLVVVISIGPEESISVPDVRGLSYDIAANLLKANQLTIKKGDEVDSDQKAGTVVKQSPAPDEKAKKGDAITVTISSGKATVDPTPPMDDHTGGDGGASDATSGSATISIAIPENAQSSAHIVVQLDDGSVVYNNTLTNVGASQNITIQGSGTRYATVYINDVEVGSQEVSFQ